jgi:hypothetical protein
MILTEDAVYLMCAFLSVADLVALRAASRDFRAVVESLPVWWRLLFNGKRGKKELVLTANLGPRGEQIDRRCAYEDAPDPCLPKPHVLCVACIEPRLLYEADRHQRYAAADWARRVTATQGSGRSRPGRDALAALCTVVSSPMSFDEFLRFPLPFAHVDACSKHRPQWLGIPTDAAVRRRHYERLAVPLERVAVFTAWLADMLVRAVRDDSSAEKELYAARDRLVFTRSRMVAWTHRELSRAMARYERAQANVKWINEAKPLLMRLASKAWRGGHCVLVADS